MKCSECDVEMKEAQLVGDVSGMQVYLSQKEKGIFGVERQGKLECFVCPKCGEVKLKATTPEIFE